MYIHIYIYIVSTDMNTSIKHRYRYKNTYIGNHSYQYLKVGKLWGPLQYSYFGGMDQDGPIKRLLKALYWALTYRSISQAGEGVPGSRRPMKVIITCRRAET